jgi:hypoxanthine-DNA glycosylase
LPTAVVVIESAEFCPTAVGLPPHPASPARITPTNSTRFMPISLIGEDRHPIRQRGQGGTCPAGRATLTPVTFKRSFPPVVDAQTRLLICGSLPGDRSLAAQRYYAHPQNQFWRLLSPVVGCNLAALDYDDRLAALLDAHIGLWDVVATATRTGSSDAAIRDHAPNDLERLAATLPELRAIAFNGGTAYKIGLRQMNQPARRYDLLSLPSSSPLHTIGIQAKQEVWTALRDYL